MIDNSRLSGDKFTTPKEGLSIYYVTMCKLLRDMEEGNE